MTTIHTNSSFFIGNHSTNKVYRHRMTTIHTNSSFFIGNHSTNIANLTDTAIVK